VADAPTELLEQIPLFEGLAHGELERIARSFKERRFGAGDIVAAEGAGGIGFFVISEGSASVDVHGEQRGKLGPGDYFGEIALIDDGARSATITAVSDLRCYGLTSWEFRPLVESNASIAWKLLETMAKRLRAAQQRLADLGGQHALQRRLDVVDGLVDDVVVAHVHAVGLGEAARLASLAFAARAARPYFADEAAFADRLRRYAQDQLDWILGRNPFDASLLQGAGHGNPEYRFFGSLPRIIATSTGPGPRLYAVSASSMSLYISM